MAQIQAKPASAPLAAPTPSGAGRRRRLAAEFLGLFFLVPILVWQRPFHFPLILALLLFFGIVLWVLWRDPEFPFEKLVPIAPDPLHLKHVVLRFCCFAPGVALFTWWLGPDHLFDFLLDQTSLWILVMVMYPVISVYPQEVIYRTFLFHRYRPLFGSTRNLVVASAIGFAFLHVVFDNWIAPVLSLGGGVLFARTFVVSEETLSIVWIEHYLYGAFIFTIGLGRYFFGGF